MRICHGRCIGELKWWKIVGWRRSTRYRTAPLQIRRGCPAIGVEFSELKALELRLEFITTSISFTSVFATFACNTHAHLQSEFSTVGQFFIPLRLPIPLLSILLFRPADWARVRRFCRLQSRTWHCDGGLQVVWGIAR